MAATPEFDKRYGPAEATRGSWVPLDSSTISNYPTGDSTSISRGRYAQLTYIMGSEPGALNISLSGGTVILPVSTVNINEPLSVINDAGTRLLVTTQDTVGISGNLVITPPTALNVTVTNELSSYILNQPIDVNIVSGITLSVSGLNIDEPITIDAWDTYNGTGGGALSAFIVNPVSSVYVNNLEQISAVNTTALLTNTTQVCSQTIAAQSSAVINFSPTITHLEIYNVDTLDTIYISYDSSMTYAQVNARGLPIVGEAYYSTDRETTTLVVSNPDNASVNVRIFGHNRV